MPKKTRDVLLRRAEQAQGALDRAVYHLQLMADTYGDDYPNYKQACELFVAQVYQTKDLIQTFRENVM